MKPYQILIFLVIIILSLALVCYLFPKDGVSFLGRRLFFPTFEEALIKEKSMSVDEKMTKIEEGIKIKAIADSISEANTEARQDSIRFYKNFFDTHPARFHLPEGDVSFFDDLFSALQTAKRDHKTIHILHYGDSQIEEDRISAIIRQRLQDDFGGIGVGLAPIMQPIPSASVGQTASGALERFIVAGMHKNTYGSSNRYGILGQCATLTGNGSIYISSHNYSRTQKGVKKWKVVKLFVIRNTTPLSITINSGNYNNTKKIETAKSTPSVIKWIMPDSVSKMRISFAGNAELSSISMEGEYGVNVDNIPIRGSSGTFFSQIDKSSFSGATKELNIKMILLEFGGNAMPSITKSNIEGYMTSLSKQIKFFQEICPNAKIILIGPADMSTKVKGNLQTYPLLPEMVDAMRKMATDNGAGFWNMFEVMGGKNSMIEWVKNSPALATPDYIHFTPRGADKIAELFYESMKNYFEFYMMKNR